MMDGLLPLSLEIIYVAKIAVRPAYREFLALLREQINSESQLFLRIRDGGQETTERDNSSIPLVLSSR